MDKNLKPKPTKSTDYYNHLGINWYEAKDDPIAVLREEQNIKNPWIKSKILNFFGRRDLDIADIGCGAGFLTNYLAENFKSVHGLDASASSIKVATQKDATQSVDYIKGSAYQLPYADNSMDVVCAMEFLEHVEDPKRVITECSRILKPGGIFFFHTFNRSFLSWLIVIKFMEWFVPKTPKNFHLLRLFIKPKELNQMMLLNQLITKEMTGVGPKLNQSFFQSIWQRRVLKGFRFRLSNSLAIGYMGYSEKKLKH